MGNREGVGERWAMLEMIKELTTQECDMVMKSFVSERSMLTAGTISIVGLVERT